MLIGLLDDPSAGRAAVLTPCGEPQRVVDAQYNQTLVMFQYFAFLRRDPDETGFTSWLNTLKTKPLRDADRRALDGLLVS